MKRILEIPFYPLVFAAYAPIYQFSKNHGLFTGSDLFIAITIQLVITAIALVIVKRVLPGWHQVSLFVTLLWIFLFAFRQFNDGQPYDGLIYFLLIFLPLCLGTYFLLRSKGANLFRFVHIFNIGSLFLAIMPVYLIISEQLTADTVLKDWPRQNLMFTVAQDKPKPNIFHIILDGYSRGDILKQVYQYDNTSFEMALEKKGFYVAKNATTPYGQTVLALSSIFNTAYLPDFDDKLNVRIQKLALTNQFQHSAVKNTLDEMGYTFISTMSPYKPARILTSNQIFPDEYNMGTLQMFMVNMYDRSLIGPLYRKITQKVASTTSISALTDYALHTAYYKKITKSPFYIFQHVLSPHPPFNIDENGNVDHANENIQDADHLTKSLQKNKLLYRSGYIAKLKYTNKAILKQTDQIIKHFSGPLIIIIHGDHGGGMHTHHEDYEKSCISERFSPFLAIYTKGVDIDTNHIETLNLVNLYRVIFNASFGSRLAILKDKNYFIPFTSLDKKYLIDSTRMAEQCPAL